jgi:two-component system, LuxR family, sensor kinase FixL
MTDMKLASSLPTIVPTRFLLVAMGLLALGIFVFDTATPYGFAVAVLYVLVVLMAASFNRRSDVLLVSAGCMLLTVLSYFLSHGTAFTEAPLVRAIMSLSAIAITTLLALKYQSATQVLHAQAELLDLTHDTVFVRDMSEVVTYWNRGAEKLYGVTREEAVGRVAHALLQTRFPEPPDKILADLLRTGRWEGELVHTRRDGTKAVVASRWALKRDERGRPQEILETSNDVTAEKHAEKGLAEAHAQLAHAMRAATLGELTASIAHEVNQPLAGIVTNGEAGLRWLKRDVPQLEEVRGAIERMIRDGRRASQVIQRLRALAKKAPMQATPLDLNEVINEAVTLVQREVLNYRIVLQLELAPDLPPVLGDRVELQQVVVNLMVNGMQAMELVVDRPRRLVVRSGLHDGQEILVSVQDSGTGIAPDDLKRLFKAFFTTKPNGMGMGLSICRSVIEAHGGRIWASSNAGPGTSFQFALPLNAEMRHEP